MLDLETLGNSSDSVIISIGAVKFDPVTKTLHDLFYSRVDPQSCIDAGLKVMGSTILWWFQQSESARKEFTGTLPSLKMALTGFTAWMNKQVIPNEKNHRVWGNGATFDNVILSNAYSAIKMGRPWSYKNDRCYRTIKALYPQIQLPNRPELISHRADHDAQYQAIHLMEIWPHLQIK